MNTIETSMILVQLQSQVGRISCQSLPVDVKMVLSFREGIAKVAQQISETNFVVSNRLVTLTDALFTEATYQQPYIVPYQHFSINPIICGQIIEALEYAKSVVDQVNCGSICHLLHPDIQRVFEKLYKDGNYANAACDAFIEINSCLQKIYRKKRPNIEKELSGQALMNKIFAEKY